MNTWLYTLDGWGYVVVNYLLAVLWQSTILFVAAAGLMWVLRGRHAAVRHTICVAAALLAPFIPFFSALASHAGTPQAPLVLVPAYEGPVANAVVSDAQVPLALTPMIHPTDRTDPTDLNLPAAPSHLLDFPWALLLFGYSAGLIFFLSLYLAGHARIRSWNRRATPLASERIRAAFDTAAIVLRFSGRLHLRNSAVLQAPVSVGLVRRIVLFPEAAAARMSDDELRAVAIHETAHLKRRDPLILSLVALVRAVFYFHPLVWIAARQVTALAEQSADDAVLDATGEPVAYAKLLTRLAEGLPRRTPSTEFAAGIVLSQNVFLRRVEAILSERRGQLRRLTRWALAGICLMAAGSLAVALAVPLESEAPGSAEAATAAPVTEPTGTAPVITGRVTDASGVPIAGALVEWGEMEAGPKERISVVTGADGVYRLEASRSGAGFRLGVSAAGYGPAWEDFHPPWTLPGSPVPDEEAHPPDQRDFTVEAAHTLRGVVVDREGAPVAGASVSAGTTVSNVSSSIEMPKWSTPLPGAAAFRVETDEKGAFVVAGLPPGEVAVKVESPHRYIPERNYPVDQPCRIVADFSGKPGWVRIRVKDQSTSQPVGEFVIARRHVPEQQHFRDVSGNAAWAEELTLDRSYEFHVYANGYLPWEGELTAGEMEIGEAAEIALQPGKSLQGRLVKENTRTPIAGASLLYARENDAYYFAWNEWDTLIDGLHGVKGVQRAVTDADGRFWFAEDTGAPGIVVVFSQGCARTIIPPDARPAPDGEGRVTFAVAQQSAITGSVKPAARDGSPAIVHLWWESTGDHLQHDFETSTVNAEGEFFFTRLQPGHYRVSLEKRISRNAYSIVPVAEADLLPGEIRDVGDLQLPAEGLPPANKVESLPSVGQGKDAQAQPPPAAPGRGSISGTVLDADTGAPVAGAFVAIDHSGDAGGSNLERFHEEGTYVTDETDEKGRFELDGVALLDVPHPFYVTRKGYVRYEQAVTLTPQEATVVLDLKLTPGARLEVTLADAGQLEKPGQIFMRLSAFGNYRFIPSGQDWPVSLHREERLRNGKAVFGELPAGTFTVEAFHATPNTLTYLGSEQVSIATGQQEAVTLSPAPSDTEVRVTVQQGPEAAPQYPGIFVLTRDVAGRVWENNLGWSFEDERLGWIQAKALAWFPAAFANTPAQEGMPMRVRLDEPFTVKGLTPGRYVLLAGNVSRFGLVVRGATVDLQAQPKTQIEISWQEPTGGSHLNNRLLIALENTVRLEQERYTLTELCALFTRGAEDILGFAASPDAAGADPVFDVPAEMGGKKATIRQLIEHLYLAKGWDFTEEFSVDGYGHEHVILRYGQRSPSS